MLVLRPCSWFVAVLSLSLACASTMVAAADWPSFRGPHGNGYADDKQAPLRWSNEQNVKWKVALPQPGNGSPIVSKGCVFVACAADQDGKQRNLYCFDRRDGRQLWVRTVTIDEKEVTHSTNPYCGSTPAANGELVVVWHGSAGLYCYNFAGTEQWHRDLGAFHHIWGYGTSPVIYRDRVIMHCGPGIKIFVTALDLATGKTLWKTDEPTMGDGSYRPDKEYMGSWTTPVVAAIEGRDQIICTMPARVVSYDPKDGSIIWTCDGISGKKGDLAYSSPVIVGDLCVSIGGYGGPSIGFKVGGTGDITTQRLWRNESNPQSIGTGIAAEGYLYRPNAGPGTLECLDPKTGKVLWTDRTSGESWGSVVFAAGRGYLTNQKGQTIVFRPQPDKFELLAQNDLGEASNATPAVSDGEIFLRTNHHLYCIAE